MKIKIQYRGQIRKLLFFALVGFASKFSFAQQSSPASPPASEVDSPTMEAKSPSQQLFFCTSRIDTKRADGSPVGTGTGFVWEHRLDDQRQILFLITCRHVVNGGEIGTFSFVQGKDDKPDWGRRYEITITNLQNWVFYDPDPQIDLALIPLVPFLRQSKSNDQPFFRALSKDLVPNKSTSEDLNAIQPIVFVGYPIGMRDEKNLLPIARRGFTASPYVVDFNGLPLFLIDANVFPGSSGSPVMVLDEGAYASQHGLVMGARLHFLGIVTSAYFQEVDGRIEFKAIPSQFVPMVKEHRFINLGGVIKAKAILNTVSKFLEAYPPPKSLSGTTNNP